MAPHSSNLAWKTPWTEEPGGLQSMGSRRVGHDWVTSLSFSLSCIGEGNGNPLQCSCLENPRDGGAWWAAIYGVAQSRTQLKQLSNSSSSSAYFLQCKSEFGNKEFMIWATVSSQCCCLENPRDGGAWWAAAYGVAQSWTRLKRLSSSCKLLKIHNLLPFANIGKAGEIL